MNDLDKNKFTTRNAIDSKLKLHNFMTFDAKVTENKMCSKSLKSQFLNDCNCLYYVLGCWRYNMGKSGIYQPLWIGCHLHLFHLRSATTTNHCRKGNSADLSKVIFLDWYWGEEKLFLSGEAVFCLDCMSTLCNLLFESQTEMKCTLMNGERSGQAVSARGFFPYLLYTHNVILYHELWDEKYMRTCFKWGRQTRNIEHYTNVQDSAKMW